MDFRLFMKLVKPLTRFGNRNYTVKPTRLLRLIAKKRGVWPDRRLIGLLVPHGLWKFWNQLVPKFRLRRVKSALWLNSPQTYKPKSGKTQKSNHPTDSPSA